MAELTDVRENVRERYAAAAKAAAKKEAAGCCGGAAYETLTHEESGDQVFGDALYAGDETDGVPSAAVEASLGCGVPTAVADLHEGETVLDLGSGAGADVLISAKRVGATGRAIGLDMTDEMLELARANARQAGADNVEFRKGYLEDMPLEDASVDVVISNCVINLASDKQAVFAEIARVLRPGGRMGVSDIVADDILTLDQRAERGSYVGCIAGALSFREFKAGLRAVGLEDVEVVPTSRVADGMHSAIIRATKPA